MAQLIDPTEAMFTAFEPKTQNRFIMYIDGIPAYLIKKIDRPSVTFGDVTLIISMLNVNLKEKLIGVQ